MKLLILSLIVGGGVVFNTPSQASTCQWFECYSRGDDRAAMPDEALRFARLKKFSRHEIKIIQRALRTVGHYRGKIDGKRKLPTRKAIKRFSIDAGLGANVHLTEPFLRALFSRANMRNSQVTAIMDKFRKGKSASWVKQPIVAKTKETALKVLPSPKPDAKSPSRSSSPSKSPEKAKAEAKKEKISPSRIDLAKIELAKLQSKSYIEACQKLAGDPYFPGANGVGTPIQAIDSAKAISVCRNAIGEDVKSLKVRYWFLRAYLAGEISEANIVPIIQEYTNLRDKGAHKHALFHMLMHKKQVYKATNAFTKRKRKRFFFCEMGFCGYQLEKDSGFFLTSKKQSFPHVLARSGYEPAKLEVAFQSCRQTIFSVLERPENRARHQAQLDKFHANDNATQRAILYSFVKWTEIETGRFSLKQRCLPEISYDTLVKTFLPALDRLSSDAAYGQLFASRAKAIRHDTALANAYLPKSGNSVEDREERLQSLLAFDKLRGKLSKPDAETLAELNAFMKKVHDIEKERGALNADELFARADHYVRGQRRYLKDGKFIWVSGHPGSSMNNRRILNLWAHAARLDHAEAQHRLAYAYYWGKRGLKSNETIARRLWTLAAGQGHEKAIDHLENMYQIARHREKRKRERDALIKAGVFLVTKYLENIDTSRLGPSTSPTFGPSAGAIGAWALTDPGFMK